MASPTRKAVPRCPRCGYDQSGACLAWKVDCPLKGTCSECGLQFEWADVFDRWRARSPWLFEHKRKGTLGIARATRSWGMAVWPPLFWKRVPLTFACGRAVLWWLPVLIGSWAVVWSSLRTAYEFFYGPPVSSGQTIPLASGLWQAIPPTRWQVIWYRLFDAWGDPWFPVNVARWDKSRVAQTLMEGWSMPMAVAASALITGLTFLSLTRSRRLCGVRASHVMRAMVYRLTPLGALYLAWMAATVYEAIDHNWHYQGLLRTYWFVPLVLCIAWGVLWWRCAFKIGWKMPDARLATLLLGAVDVLSFVVVFMLTSPYVAGHWLI